MSDLVWSIKNGDLESVKDSIEKKNINVNDVIDGRTPLHYASDYGQLDVLEYLITKGADVNALDKHGISCILAAIWEGHITCVKLLLDSGAKKNGQTPDGTSYVDATDKPEIKSLLA